MSRITEPSVPRIIGTDGGTENGGSFLLVSSTLKGKTISRTRSSWPHSSFRSGEPFLGHENEEFEWEVLVMLTPNDDFGCRVFVITPMELY